MRLSKPTHVIYLKITMTSLAKKRKEKEKKMILASWKWMLDTQPKIFDNFEL